MGLGVELSPSTRSRIIGAKENRVPLTDISKRYNIPYSTVKYTWQQRTKRAERKQVFLHRQRPFLTSQEEDAALYRITRENPTITLRQLSGYTRLKPRLIKRHLAKFGGHFKKYKMTYRPRLTRANKRVRFDWSLKHEHDPIKQWENTWWTDECSVELGSGWRQKWVWRHTGEQWVPDFIGQKPPKGVRVMIWVGLKADGTIVLRFLNGDPDSPGKGVTARVYFNMVSDFLLKYY